MYSYTRISNNHGSFRACLFIRTVPPSRYICFSLRARCDLGRKSPIHVHKLESFVGFVHIICGFSGVSGGCIFTHPLSEGQFQVAGSQLHVHGVFTAARVMFAVVVVIISIVALRVVYIHVTAVQVCGQVVTGSGEGCCYRSIPGAGSD